MILNHYFLWKSQKIPLTLPNFKTSKHNGLKFLWLSDFELGIRSRIQVLKYPSGRVENDMMLTKQTLYAVALT